MKGVAKWAHLEACVAPEIVDGFDHVPRWRRESCGTALVDNLIGPDLQFSILDSYRDNTTTLKRTEKGLSMYIERFGGAKALPQMPCRVSWKYVRDDGRYEKIAPSACDMTEKLWGAIMRGVSNSTLLLMKED